MSRHLIGLTLISSLLAATVAAADQPPATASKEQSMPSITSEPWGKMPDGRVVHLFTLTNASGMTMRVCEYGGTIVSLTAPDREGKFADIVLGYDRLEDYLKGSPYFGAIVGRYANRIADGKFTLDGKTYTLAKNNEPGGMPCHLHGGKVGFDKVLWKGEALKEGDRVGVKLRYRSPDGEEGFPGNLDVTVHYWLNNDNSLRVEYEATTDKPTPINLSQHSYFNLGGHDSGTILDHELMIAADHITPVNKGLIPTGQLQPVEGTPFDFRTPKPIGKDVNAKDEQISYGPGYDHNFVLREWDGSLRSFATVYEPRSGRMMEVLTTEPAVQFYSGNFLDGSNIGKGGKPYAYRTGFCFEPQHFPDSPNQPQFPSTILRPGEVYRHTSVYKFTAK